MKDTLLVEAHLFSVDTSVCTLDGEVLDLSNVKPRAKELWQLVFLICLSEYLDLVWLDLVERNKRCQMIKFQTVKNRRLPGLP